MNSSQGKEGSSERSELQNNLELLRQVYFFSGLPLETLKVLAYLCTRELFRKGEFLFHQDDNDGQAFYIISGKAGLLCKDEKGEFMVREYGPGDFLGGMVLLGNIRRLFSLKALEDMSCLILTRDNFAVTLERFPELMRKIIRSVVKAIEEREQKFLNLRKETCETCSQMIGFTLL
ncbi:MAG: cyclic nucleotide-binding domain-containing protein [Deltaproteobacteria bacterium]|nr:cyclic nucleotide-binding domain-containing protein [Deltaproteobacteria bacterium]